MGNIKKLLVLSLVSAGIGGWIAYKVLPPREVVKIEEKEVIKNHTVTQIKEVIRPDGTKETNTTIINDSKTTISKQTQKDWFATVGIARTSLTSDNIYQLGINRRILGPFYVGGSVTSDKQLGVNIGIEF